MDFKIDNKNIIYLIEIKKERYILNLFIFENYKNIDYIKKLLIKDKAHILSLELNFENFDLDIINKKKTF